MSTLFLRTLREDPSDAEVPSHRLLVRAGYIRRAGARRIHMAAARLDRVPQRREHHPRGDGRGRVPGGALPGAPAEGAVRDLEPMDRVRRQPVPPQGSPRQRLPPRPDARGVVHAPREGSLLVVPRPAAAHLPDPDQVPGRGATARRAAARARVRDEGLVLVRHRRRRICRSRTHCTAPTTSRRSTASACRT